VARVLVIDDDPAVRLVLQRNLEHAGFDVMTAEEGLGGLAAALAEAPDVVVLDLMMPNVDGFVVLDALRRDPRTSAMPVIVLTAVTAPGMKERCEEAGASLVMTKPFEPSKLAAGINAILTVGSGRSQPTP
jgi:DNA-binding response OmpR family regulator